MRILADIRLLSRGGVSGIEEYTQNLLKALLIKDKENDYSLFYNGVRKISLNFPEAKIIDWRVPNKFFDFSSRFFQFPKIENFIKTDLIFSPHFNILAAGKTPRVVTFHDLSFLHHPQFFSWKQKFWHWLQNVKDQAQKAQKIIAVSEFTKSDLVNLLGIPPEKITVIYSGISEEFRKTSRPQTQYSRPYILYLGTLEPRKNVSAIIRAFNILKTNPDFKNWQLIIAGRPGWLYENILKEAQKSPHREEIIFTGAVNADERFSLYNSAKVFVYPSFFEGFGFPPLEAQACGCPAVVSNRTSLPEVMGESALLVDPWKIEELASAIKEIAVNESLRNQLVKSGYENAQRFNWGKTAQATIELFNHVRQ